jgi:sulfate permease, SulP family
MNSRQTLENSPPVHSATGATAALGQTGNVSGLSGRTLPNFVAGAVAALVTLSYSVSYGALVFSGQEIEPFLASGLHAALMSAWIVAIAVTLGSSLHFAIAGPDSNATAVLAVMSALMTEKLRLSGASGQQIAATVLAMLSITAVLTGICVLGIGASRRGKLVRFLPYPVVGGFLAGTGYLIFSGGFKVFSGKALSLEIFSAFPSISVVAWAVTGGVAISLLVLPRYIKHFMLMPAVIVLGVISFYAGLHLSGIDFSTAREQDMMFKPLASGLKAATVYSDLPLVRWDVIFGQWQNFLAMTIVVVVTILLNATGLELATQSDVDFDRELRANGIANILAGIAGGMIGYLSVSRSLLNFKGGAKSRAAGIVTALICLGATFLFTPAIAFFPRPVLAGLLIFLGLSMLREWLWDAFFKLPVLEYMLIISIVALIITNGLISGVAFGLLVASVFFVYSYSRTNCIKHLFSSATHFSNKERTLEQTLELKEKGKCCRSLSLQGYLFFGTSSAIVETCRDLIDKEKLKYVLLDFRLVQGADTSAVLSFVKLQQLCNRGGVQLMLSGLRPDIEAVFEQARFLPNSQIRIFSEMDYGLEWVEDSLLGVVAGNIVVPRTGDTTTMFGTALNSEMDLKRILSTQFDAESINLLISYCQTMKVAEGAALFRRGDPGDALYFIERGEVSVLLPLENGQSKRLRTFGPGTVVGEMGVYGKQPRSADVVAKMNCRVRKLTAEDLGKLERENPEVAIKFHTFVIRRLSARVIAANDEIRELI